MHSLRTGVLRKAGIATAIGVSALVAVGAAPSILANAGESGAAAALTSDTAPGTVYTPPAIVPASSSPIVAVATPSSSDGAWEAASDGEVYASGEAPALGSMSGSSLNAPVVGMATTHTGGGYWLVASDGGIFAFGSAEYHGSTGDMHLNAPIVGMASDPATGGYWLVASDGGIFSFTAPFYGSTGAEKLNEPIVGMAAAPTGHGYWLVASDGGIFTFGSAEYHGSTGGEKLNAPIVGMAVDPSTGGYWLVASDGGIFAFTAPFYGSSSFGDVTSIASEDGGQGYLWCDSSGVCQSASAADQVTGHADIPPEEPPADVAMDPTFEEPAAGATPGPCFTVSGRTDEPDYTKPACVTAEVSATNHARSLEGLPDMQLPDNFSSLTPEEQLFVLTDIERVSRGEQPVLGLSSVLDTDAHTGAVRNTDPGFSVLKTLPTYDGAGSNWGASRSALEVDYYWLYLDGWDGTKTSNADCTSATASGCWAHRDNILKPSQVMVMGVGFVPDNWNGYNSYAEVLVTLRSSSKAPAMYYTWADAVAAGAGA